VVADELNLRRLERAEEEEILPRRLETMLSNAKMC
jgi:hypothetical protein